MDPAFRRSDRHRVLQHLAEHRSASTLEMSIALNIEVRRLGQVIGDMRAEHMLEAGAKVEAENGYKWLSTEVGDRELARMNAVETGVRFSDVDPDEAALAANMRRIGR